MSRWLPVGIATAILLVGALAAAVMLRPRTVEPTSQPPSPYRGSIPPRGIHAADFALHDYRGATVRMHTLRGRVAVVSFVDSKCTEKCPIVTAVIARALRQLPADTRREVVALLITVDPEVDTPQNVERFLEARRARGLHYLTGSVSALRPVWKAYGILPASGTRNPDFHSSDVRIFNRDGIWVSTQHAGVDLTARNLDHDISVALRATA